MGRGATTAARPDPCRPAPEAAFRRRIVRSGVAPRILHYSDVENAHDDPERVGRLAGLIDARREGALVVGTGDDTAPGVLSLVTDGRQAVPFLRAVDPDFETFGNHDFDHGVDGTERIVRGSPTTWLTANVHRDGRRLFPEATAPWAVTRARAGGDRIGLVGVTTPDAARNPAVEELTFADPAAAVRDAAGALRERDVDRVVVLSHCGRDDERIAVECDVDAVLGGHVHTERVERIDGTLLTRPGVNGRVVLEVDLGADGGAGAVTRHEVAGAALDGAVAARFRELRADAGVDETVAHVAEPIERTEATAHRGESRIGNLVADALRWAVDADVALQNGGGLRAGDPLAGDVAVGDLLSVLPFEEPVVAVELSGARLRRVVAQSDGADATFGDPDWWHGHFAGLSVHWDGTPGIDDGSGGSGDESDGDADDNRILSLTVDGEPVDPDGSYRLATTSFLLATDGEFPALSGVEPVATGPPAHEALVAYARETGIDPAIEGRIVGR